MVSRRTGAVVIGGAVVLAVATATVPLPVVLGTTRLIGLTIMAAGAWLVVGRGGFVDLSVGASAGAGAYLGGVLAAVAGTGSGIGLVAGAAAGAGLTALSSAVAGRVGRAGGALTSLAIGTAAVALLRAWPAGGGAAGFHAVPLLLPGDRVAMFAGLLLVAGAFAATTVAARHRVAAAAAVASHAPVLAASLGRRPVADAAWLGAIAGALLGLGGAAQAFLVGSVNPSAFGLSLSAALALAALIGGPAPAGPLVGALLLWGPGIIWPLVPVIGDGPVLLSTGLLALALLALRRGRPLVALPTSTTAPAATGPVATALAHGDAPPPGPVHRAGLTVDRVELPGGRVSLRVAPGEVVALCGPNGSGKSTLLARIAGQLPADDSVRIDEPALPSGPVGRARTGIARTWQHPPQVAPGDALAASHDGSPDAIAAIAWATAVLGDELVTTPAGSQLVRLVARRPAVALLDEPGATVPIAVAAALVRGLAAAGTAVLVVEHRADVVAVADRVLQLGSDPAAAVGLPRHPDDDPGGTP